MPRLPALSPHGRLFLDESEAADAGAAPGLSSETKQRIGHAFAESSARGLLALAVRRGEGGRPSAGTEARLASQPREASDCCR